MDRPLTWRCLTERRSDDDGALMSPWSRATYELLRTPYAGRTRAASEAGGRRVLISEGGSDG